MLKKERVIENQKEKERAEHMQVQKTIQATRDVRVSTGVDSKQFNRGEVGTLKFSSEQEFRNHLVSGVFVEVPTGTKPGPVKINSIPKQNQVPVNSGGKINQIKNTQAPAITQKEGLGVVRLPENKINNQEIGPNNIMICPKDGQRMIITTDAAKVEYYFCPKCGTEITVAEVLQKKQTSEEEENINKEDNKSLSVDTGNPSVTNSKRVLSKCACSRVKPKDSELCKKCAEAKAVKLASTPLTGTA